LISKRRAHSCSEIDSAGALRLVGQMPAGVRDRQLALLTAFHAGLLGEPLSPSG
jgi:hypothetical protein